MRITAYKTSDGQLFLDEDKANSYQEDILGQLLDDFLPNDDRGNVTRVDRYSILMKQLKDPDLYKKITALYQTVEFMQIKEE
jgi:hypothetical protein